MKLPKRRILLALDVGFTSCGFVVIDLATRKIKHARCIHTEAQPKESASVGYARRSREIAYQLDKICADHLVTEIAGEMPHGGAQSARAMAYMTMAISIVAVFCALRNIPFCHQTPNQSKQLVRRKGKVDKAEVEKVVIDYFGSEFLPKKQQHREHISDAAATALVYFARKD